MSDRLTKHQILKQIEDRKRAQMVDFAVAVANEFKTHIECQSCSAPNEIKREWYTGLFRDLCCKCGEELDFWTALNIKENVDFKRWVSKRTYENNPIEESRIEKRPEYEITKVEEIPDLGDHQAAIDELTRDLIDEAWAEANDIDLSKYSSVDDREVRFNERLKCAKKKKKNFKRPKGAPTYEIVFEPEDFDTEDNKND